MEREKNKEVVLLIILCYNLCKILRNIIRKGRQMVTYAANELISSSDFSKKFGSYLAQIRENSINKLAILKNNKVEAVMVSKDEYEKMREAYDLVEHMEIYNMVEKRISKPYKTISLEEMAEKHNIDLDKLD